MAQRVEITFIDDVTKTAGPDVETHTFVIDGKAYDIDLSSKSYEKILKALAPVVENGRRAKRGPTSTVAKPKSSEDTAAIRKWAEENGYEVAARGRVPAEIREAYAKAN